MRREAVMVTAVRLAENPFKSAGGSSSKFLEQLHAKGFYGFYSRESWAPNVNLYETDWAYMVCVDLAGVEKEKIDLEVADGQLTIRGNRVVPSCTDVGGAEITNTRVRVHLMEIDHGAFARAVELPDDVQRENIKAVHKNGMLWIELPKK
jgi:HSP20 family protein